MLFLTLLCRASMCTLTRPLLLPCHPLPSRRPSPSFLSHCHCTFHCCCRHAIHCHCCQCAVPLPSRLSLLSRCHCAVCCHRCHHVFVVPSIAVAVVTTIASVVVAPSIAVTPSIAIAVGHHHIAIAPPIAIALHRCCAIHCHPPCTVHCHCRCCGCMPLLLPLLVDCCLLSSVAIPLSSRHPLPPLLSWCRCAFHCLLEIESARLSPLVQ
jgi:hypothetical protein